MRINLKTLEWLGAILTETTLLIITDEDLWIGVETFDLIFFQCLARVVSGKQS